MHDVSSDRPHVQRQGDGPTPSIPITTRHSLIPNSLTMVSSLPPASPEPHLSTHSFLHDADDDDADTASQRSISLSSPPISPRNSIPLEPRQGSTRNSDDFSKRESHPYTVDTDLSSEVDDASIYTHETGTHESPSTSAPPSIYEEGKGDLEDSSATYPPRPASGDDTMSIASFASGSSRKARPESMLVGALDGPLVLGIALVDFNHLVCVFPGSMVLFIHA